ncbi:MAG TPA: hypothetical protein EYP06_00610, partial [Desulfobacterales bacterium]|nr:hypothetical protein [Desulfobacterales bacterium]
MERCIGYLSQRDRGRQRGSRARQSQNTILFLRQETTLASSCQGLRLEGFSRSPSGPTRPLSWILKSWFNPKKGKMENESQTKGLENLGEKKERLLRILAGMNRALVAFSGGLDSSFLLAVAKEALGDKVVAATASSPIHPMRELEIAKKFCMEQGIKHLVFESREMSIDRFLENPPDRCYWCKRAMLIQLKEMAERDGLGPILHGLNKDELRDYRPGNRASQELGIR